MRNALGRSARSARTSVASFFGIACAAGIPFMLASAQPECGNGWRLSPETAPIGVGPYPVTSGTVFDLDGAGPEPELVYFGGRLRNAGYESAGGVGQWDGRAWRATGIGMRQGADDAQVFALRGFGSELIAGGFFDTADNLPALNISRWNGTRWTAIGEGLDNSVFALGEFNGQLIAGGSFGFNGSGSPRGIACWDGSSWKALAGGVNAWVRNMTVFDGELIVAGDFSEAGGVQARGIAAWNGVSWHGFGAGPGGNVSCAAVHKGVLYAGGLFFDADGKSMKGVASWDGSKWNRVGDGFEEGAAGTLTSLGDELVASGGIIFDGTPGAPGRSGSSITFWNGVSWRGAGISGGVRGKVCGVQQGALIVADGGLSDYFGAYYGPLALKDGVARALTSGLAGRVLAMQSFGSEVAAIGLFRQVLQRPVESIARWSGREWLTFPAFPGGGSGRPSALGVWKDRLVVGQEFRDFDTGVHYSVLEWDGSAWNEVGDSPLGSVSAFLESGGKLIAAGHFSRDEVSYSPGFAVWDGSGWVVMNEPSGSKTVEATCMAEYRGELYAGGAVQSGDEDRLLNLGRWDGSSWQPVGVGLSGTVTMLRVYKGELIVGGRISVVGKPEIKNLARWDGVEWRWLGIEASYYTFYGVDDIVEYNGELVFGGRYMPNASPYVPPRLARWDGERWSTFAEGFSSLGYALAVHRGELLIGGDSFRSPVLHNYLARWSDSGIPWVATQPEDARVVLGRDVELRARSASGYGAVHVRWTRNGETIFDGAGGASAGGGLVEGANTESLRILGAGESDAGRFEAIFTNECGEMRSNGASVFVEKACLADFNFDWRVDDVDFGAFAAAYSLTSCAAAGMGAGCPADLNGDRVVDDSDFTLFARAYDALLCY